MGGRRITPLTETGIVAELLRSRRGTGAALSAVQVPNPAKDSFTVAATPATTYTLTYLPLEQSVNFSLNGLEMLEGTDYTVDYATGIVTVDPAQVTLKATPAPADVLTADYWTTGALVAQTLPPDTGSFSDTVSGLSPRIYWRFTETSGATVADASGNGRDGTLTGAGAYTRGTPSLLWTDDDPSVFLDTSAGMVYSTVAHDAALATTAESIMFFYLKNQNPTATLYQHDNRSRVQLASPDLTYDIWNGTTWVTIGTAANIIGGDVHAYLVTYDGTTLTFLRDGQTFSTVTASTALPAGSGSVSFGSVAGIAWTYTLDEFAWWGEIITEAQFASAFAASNGPVQRVGGGVYNYVNSGGPPGLPTDTQAGDLGVLVLGTLVGSEPTTLNGWTKVSTAPATISASGGSYIYDVSVYTKTLSGPSDTFPATIDTRAIFAFVVLAGGATVTEVDYTTASAATTITAPAATSGVTAFRAWLAAGGDNHDNTWGRQHGAVVNNGLVAMQLTQDSGSHSVTETASAATDWIVTTIGAQ